MKLNIWTSETVSLPPQPPEDSSCITIWPSITHSSLLPSICSPLNSLSFVSVWSKSPSCLPADPLSYPSLPLCTLGWTKHLWQSHCALLPLASSFFLLYKHTLHHALNQISFSSASISAYCDINHFLSQLFPFRGCCRLSFKDTVKILISYETGISSCQPW